MTPTFDFPEIISLLNHSKNITIDNEPAATRKGRWSLHKGRYTVHTSTTEFEVLYIGSSATHDDMDDAARHYKKESTQVVYANSLERHRKRYHEERLGQAPERFWSTRDYLRSFIRDELDTYLEQLRHLTPEFYMEPYVETPLGNRGKTPNRLLSFLESPRFDGETVEGLTVLLGEPGQGKTYMSRHLVSRLAGSSHLVPIYINSTQWQSMSRDQLSSLQKTIAHSFRHFEAPIAWVDGQEERFLKATLKADLFRVIFDGFDEYILRNEGRLSVTEALEELTELVRSTGARIVITSRASFWDSNVDDDELAQKTRDAVYKICPFDVQQAKQYFWNRFSGSRERQRVDRATGIYGPLAKQDPEFIGRGFILKLVGDLVEGDPSEIAPSAQEVAAMRWLVEAFCEREVTRQQLPLSAGQQLRVLETFASEIAMGAQPDSEALEVCVLEAAPELVAEDRLECMKRMEPHPLLTRVPGEDRWRWSQEQVGNVFLARWLCQVALDTEVGDATLKQFLEKQSLTASQMNDLAAMVVSVMPESHEGAQFITSVVGRILEAARATKDSGGSRGGRTLAAVVALKSVDHFCPKGSVRKERAGHLLRVLGGSPIRGIAFTGTVAAMDLSGVSFAECHFNRVVWANVEFDEKTRFERCHFVGGIAERSSGLGRCEYDNCTWDVEARAAVRAAQAREGRRRYSGEDLKADVGAVISKFVNRAGFLQTVEIGNLGRGVIRTSKFRKEIIDEICAQLLDQHHISGVGSGGFNIKPEAADSVLFYANNGVMTGRLKEVFEGIARRLDVNVKRGRWN